MVKGHDEHVQHDEQHDEHIKLFIRYNVKYYRLKFKLSGEKEKVVISFMVELVVLSGFVLLVWESLSSASSFSSDDDDFDRLIIQHILSRKLI